MNFIGINAKIERADDQIQTFDADIDKFCAVIKRSIVRENDRGTGEQKWVFRGVTPEPPIEWSIRAGEILYNLRSALDHLVWQLVLANGQEPTRDNQFPICDEEAAWANRRTNKLLEGVAKNDKETIRYLQPFNPFLQLPINGQNRPCNAQVFRTLRDLCNVDKHRHLNLVLARIAGIEPIVFGENHPPLRPSDKSLEMKGRRGRIERNMVLLTADDAEQELEPNFVISAKFQCHDQHILTHNTVTGQLRECLEAVQGGCALFRPV